MKTNQLLCFALALFLTIAAKAQEQPQPIKVATDSGYVVYEEWEKHINEQMAPYIKKASKKMKAGDYTIDVRLLVEKDGSINSVKVLNDPGRGLGEVAEQIVKRLSKKGPRWIPEESFPNKIRSYKTVVINFSVTK